MFWKFELKWMRFSSNIGYCKNGLFLELLWESSGFCKRFISAENRSFDLNLSGHNKDYEVYFWTNFQAKILCWGISCNILWYAKNSVKWPYFEKKGPMARILLGLLSILWALPMSKIWDRKEVITSGDSLVSKNYKFWNFKISSNNFWH